MAIHILCLHGDGHIIHIPGTILGIGVGEESGTDLGSGVPVGHGDRHGAGTGVGISAGTGAGDQVGAGDLTGVGEDGILTVRFTRITVLTEGIPTDLAITGHPTPALVETMLPDPGGILSAHMLRQ